MEIRSDSIKTSKSFLGKKTKKSHISKEPIRSPKADNSSLFETSTELSSNNLLSLEEKTESKGKIIQGFDEIKVPSFLNDLTDNKNVHKAKEKYSIIKAEMGSTELAKLYLIDINKMF